MLYIIIIFVLYSVNIVNCESYNKYSGYSNVFNSNVFTPSHIKTAQNISVISKFTIIKLLSFSII